ncbi:MAG TPA: ABC transporter permease subunit [Acidimicrobiales bacterium]|nr:ABC transporter permease subunit [Acidimicrobiales bacterium]
MTTLAMPGEQEAPDATPPAAAKKRKWNRTSIAFVVPAAVWLGLIVVYPVVATIRYSFFNESGSSFVGLTNYKNLFTSDALLTAFRNNFIWVVIFPFFVTFFGLVFAVLTERIKWATAFKTIIIMPIVFSTTASALVWSSLFDLNPHVGALNALVETVSDWFNPPGAYPVDTAAGQTVASLASSGVRVAPGSNLRSVAVVRPGGTVRLGLVGISPATLQVLEAEPATLPKAQPGAVTGLVWRDFSPSHPASRTGVFRDEDGLPNLRLSLLASNGSSVASAVSDRHGLFAFTNVRAGAYHVQIDSSNFRSGFTGVFWLGTQSLTPTNSVGQTAQALLSVPLVDMSMIVTYLWIWCGFAMVVLAAGLASLDRAVLEAARMDGATEWQTFRRVTMPLLAPVLTVIFVTMIINVLKVFDVILNEPPGSSQEGANTLALSIYNFGFTGGIHTGLASAIAVILFLLVVPVMLWNLKKLKQPSNG